MTLSFAPSQSNSISSTGQPVKADSACGVVAPELDEALDGERSHRILRAVGDDSMPAHGIWGGVSRLPGKMDAAHHVGVDAGLQDGVALAPIPVGAAHDLRLLLQALEVGVGLGDGGSCLVVLDAEDVLVPYVPQGLIVGGIHICGCKADQDDSNSQAYKHLYQIPRLASLGRHNSNYM